MLVVSDASPINVLIRIGQVEILPELFGSVMVPNAVAEEMSHPSTPPIIRDWMANPPGWLSIRAPASPSPPLLLRHRGERDAISLAVEVCADAILLDEEKPRAQATALGLLVIGTVGILERAADVGIIKDLKEVHERLRTTDFRVRDAILVNSLHRHLSR